MFFKTPAAFDKTNNKEFLSYALGATLYMPATRENIAQEVINRKNEGLISMVLCLEDAIGDNEIRKAKENVTEQINLLSTALKMGEVQEIPLIFIRVRNPRQVEQIAELLDKNLSIITGFVFPKFSSQNGHDYFNSLKKVNHSGQNTLYGMPILETRAIIYQETRANELTAIKKVLDDYNELVLNIRIGATDFSSLFGLRRGCDTTIYDIVVIRDCIADIINLFSRMEQEYVISGTVWEYFSPKTNRVLKPQLRQSPFQQEYGQTGLKLRTKMLDQYIDGLIKEVLLDKANGMIGKTVIHPSHIKPVQALNVVDFEEYNDAVSILSNNDKGVVTSNYLNKMNEIKPHSNWARRIILKSEIYGVFHEKHNFTSLLQ